MDPLIEALTLATGAAVLLAAVATAAWTRRLAATVGRARHRERPRRALRVPLVLGVAALGLAVSLGGPSASQLVLLAGAGLLALVAPGSGDSDCGERGVRAGWFARRYEDLDEWRLTGEHLRWKLFGTWVSSRVPTSEHADLRTRLERACPERESRFRT
jgi:hypothetical protein